MEVLLGCLCVLALVTVIGHGLWLLCAGLFRALQGGGMHKQGPPLPRKGGPRRQPCVRCGLKLPWDVLDCPRCGLDREGLVAAELTDLEAMARQLERFQKRQTMPQELIEQMWQTVQDRHSRLVGSPDKDIPVQPLRPLPAAAAARAQSPASPLVPALPLSSAVAESPPRPAPIPAAEESSQPPWVRLEQLLSNCRDAAELTSSDRVHVLLWYRQSPPAHLADLPARCQHVLARVLQNAGLADEALLTYERLLERYPGYLGLADIALEAGRLAAANGRTALARRFLEQALAGGLAPPDRSEAEQLLHGQSVPVEEEIPLVVRAARRSPEPAPLPSAPAPAVEPVPAARPRRSLSELLSAFMEDRNILWGELVGGLLIVGGSIALVLSLWNRLQENPYSPFGIFAAITAALFGAGLYTLHHWKLESTSRGLLVIAALLVPLNFMVMPSMLQAAASDTRELLIAAVVLVAFAWFLHRAGRVLVPGSGWLLPLVVLGCAVSQLLSGRLLGAEQPAGTLLVLLGAVPAVCQGVSVGLVVGRMTRAPALPERDAWSLFALLGLAAFAVAAALGFLTSRCEDVGLALKYLALPAAGSALPVLAGGLLIHHRLAQTPELGGVRTTGTAIVLTGIAVLVLAVALAWPLPWMTVAVCTLNFLVLSLIAFRYQLPVAHAVALACAALGYFLTFHLDETLDAGLSERLLASFVTLEAGTSQAALTLLVVAAAEALGRLGRRVDALYYGVGGGLIALASVALVTRHGLGAPANATFIYALYAVLSLALNWRWRRPWLTYVSMALVCGATLWALQWGWPEQYPLWSAVLAAEALIVGGGQWAVGSRLNNQPEAPAREGLSLAGASGWSSFSLPTAFALPLARSAEVIGWLAAALGIVAGWFTPWQGDYVITGGCLLGLHLLLTVRERRPAPARVAGVMLIGTVTAAAGWAGTLAAADDLQAWIALCLAATSTLMAAVMLAGARRLAVPPWYAVLTSAWREMTALAGLLGLALCAKAPSFPQAELHTFTGASLAATAWLLTLRYRSAVLSWVGSTLFLLSLGHLLSWVVVLPIQRRLIVALLLHATLVLLAALWLLARWQQGKLASDLRRVIIHPLIQAALASTFLALPLLVLLDPGSMTPRALCMGWLAGLWLVIAWSFSRRDLFAAFQVALSVAVVYGVTAWLEDQPWVFNDLEQGLWDPRSLQAYGVGLAGLCLLGVAARIVLLRNAVARRLLLPDRPGVDRILLGLLLLGQMGLADWGVLPGLFTELTPQGMTAPLDWWPNVYVHAHGPGAWLLLGALALVTLAALWQPPVGRRQAEAVLGLVVLALTVPVLTAGAFAESQAVASALRWGLAICFLACSALLWLRRPLARLAAALYVPYGSAGNVTATARRLLLDGSVLPVLALSGLIAYLAFNGLHPTGPAADSFFGRIGHSLSVFLPLTVISLTLVGHALRERSAGYAFTAGLLVDVIVMGGYALHVVLSGEELSDREWVILLQLGTVSAAAWAIGWLLGRRRVAAWHEGPEAPLARPLMLVQIGMAIVGNVWVLLGALALLTFAGSYLTPAGTAPWYAQAPVWTLETGSPLGWLALGLTAGAVYLRQERSQWELALGAFGLAGLGLLACSVERTFPGFGYRTLLAAWAGYALAWSVIPWWLTRAEKNSTPEERIALPATSAPLWAAIAAVLVVLLGIEASVVHRDQLWAASVVAVVSAAWGLLAVQRRRGDWAFLAGLGVNLAASLVVWHVWRGSWLDQWWVLLVQVNGIASAAVALVWLRLRPYLYDPAALAWPLRGMLTVQIKLAVIANAIVLGVSFWLLYLWPAGPMSLETLQAGQLAGWLALALTMTAAVWHMSRAVPRYVVHVVGACGILLAVLIASTAGAWDHGDWVAYHVLLLAVAVLGLALLAGGWVGAELSLVGPVFWAPERRERCARLLAQCFPVALTQRWIEGIGIILVGLALRAAVEEPAQPFWPVSALLAASVLAGGLALWSGRPYYVNISGALGLAAGLVGWLAWGEGRIETLLYTSILCLGAMSAIWSVLELRLRRRVGPDAQLVRSRASTALSGWSAALLLGMILLIALFGPRFLASPTLQEDLAHLFMIACLPVLCVAIVLTARFSQAAERRARLEEEEDDEAPAAEERGRSLSFSQAAGLLGLNLLALLVVLGLGSDLTDNAIHLAGPLAWTAWGVTALASVLRLWNTDDLGRGLRTLPIYVVGLLALGLALHGLWLTPDRLCWTAALALAAYVLLTSLVAWAAPRLTGLWQALRLPAARNPWPEVWLLPLEAGLAALVAALGVWMSFGFADLADRLAGPLAVALLVPAGVFWADLRQRQGGSAQVFSAAMLRTGTLLLGVLVLAEAAWAGPTPGDASAWLNRNVLLFVALALMTLVYGLGLKRLLPHQERWAESGQRLGPRLGLAAALVVLVVLGQEMLLYEPAVRATPMEPWAIALVIAALLGLVAASISFAVLPHRDPFGLSERWRTLYVYAAEGLLVLLFLHLRLTVPQLFSGLLARYWTVAVMVLAFAGVGLSEFFQRRNLRVLAEPLQRTGVFLPLLPLLAFWLRSLAGPLDQLGGEHLGDIGSLLDFLRDQPHNFGSHGLIWFLVGVLYAAVAVTRRSFRFALLAALAANFGLWALFYHYRDFGLDFLSHPQLWLIPLALIVLTAEHLNRDRLAPAQAAGLRYLGLIVLYLSSTADLFIAGLGDVGLSLVLAVLAVLGVLAGIQFRVRAFLFVGITFLLLVLFARIWYAAVTQEQTWVWWVAVIVLGAAILTLFAVFEKRRNEVLNMLEELKRWK